MKKRILFIISDTGGGHRSAANAIAAELGGKADCLLVDLLRSSGLPGIRNAPELYGFFSSGHIWLHNLLYRLFDSMTLMNWMSSFLYRMARNRIKQIVDGFQPNVVVVIHPLAVRPMCSYRDDSNAGWPVVCVVTDLVSIHASWLSPLADQYLMPTQTAVDLAVNCGVPKKLVRLSGFPVHPRFLVPPLESAEAKRHLGIESGRFTALLVSGGAGGGNLAELVETLEQGCPEFALLVVCGRNEALKAKLAQRRSGGTCTQIFGFVDNMDLLLAACDVVITKAGPGTIMEAAAFSRRLIVTGAVGLQESGNIDFVRNHGLGVFCPQSGDIVRVMHQMAAEAYFVAPGQNSYAGTADIAATLLALPPRIA